MVITFILNFLRLWSCKSKREIILFIKVRRNGKTKIDIQNSVVNVKGISAELRIALTSENTPKHNQKTNFQISSLQGVEITYIESDLSINKFTYNF